MFQTKEPGPGRCQVARAAGVSINAVRAVEEEGNYFTWIYINWYAR
ncbi:MAG: hypothetical protein JRD68_06800 [Deltaproteobacteria bacterium]|nr:hypothetical protein [Deltaproteobacteria bacterium]